MNLKFCSFALAFLAFASPVFADPEILTENDVVYGKGGPEDLHLDIARPAGEGPFPAIIAIHGGSWRAGNKVMFRSTLTTLAKRGYVAISIQYRFAPKYQWPAQIEDCKCAVRWLRANAKKFHLDTSRIGAVGFSAGAHLALLLGSMDDNDPRFEGKGGHGGHSSKVQAVCNYFGPTDMRPLGGRVVADFMGGSVTEKKEAYKNASPVTHIDKNDAPVLTLHGTKDPLVPYKQALQLRTVLDKAGVKNKLWTCEGGGHGWQGPKLKESFQECLKFFGEHLREGEKAAPKKKRFY